MIKMKTEEQIKDKIKEIKKDRDNHEFFKFHKSGQIDILRWVLK